MVTAQNPLWIISTTFCMRDPLYFGDSGSPSRIQCGGIGGILPSIVAAGVDAIVMKCLSTEGRRWIRTLNARYYIPEPLLSPGAPHQRRTPT